MANLRLLINDHFKKKIKDADSVAVLFSGGTDSLTCLFSLLDLGIKPKLYSFHLEDVVHQDIIISKKVAEYYNLSHEIISIPKDIEQLKNDVKYIIKTFKVTRKTNVQCVYPFLHMLPVINEKYIVSGLAADDLYGSTKGASIKGSKSKEAFDELRSKTLKNLDSSAYRPIKELVEDVHKKVFVAPYREKEIIDFMMSFSWQELNKPKQKMIAVKAYKEYFNKQDIYRRSNSLQVGSKIREWHNALIETDLNKNNRWRVDEIYKDLGKELLK